MSRFQRTAGADCFFLFSKNEELKALDDDIVLWHEVNTVILIEVGPRLAAVLREKSMHDACHDLCTKVSDSDFVQAFGNTKDKIDLLITQNTVTVNR